MATQDKFNNLASWKYKIEGMDFLDYPDGYNISREKDVPSRFIDFVSGFAVRLLSGEKTGLDYMSADEANFAGINYASEALPDGWWDIAKRVGEGKTTERTIPRLSLVTEEDKHIVYDAFLPAYRAMKESLTIFKWIFDHDKYVAARESMKALSGLMQSLTGDTSAELNKAYKDYAREVKLGAFAGFKIRSHASSMRKQFKQEQRALEEELKNQDELTRHIIEAAEEPTELDDDYLYEEDDISRTSISVLEEDESKPRAKLSDEVDEMKGLTKSKNIVK